MKETVKLRPISLGLIITVGFVLSIAIDAPLASSGSDQTSSLRIYTSDGFKPALQALLPEIEQTIGRRVSPEFDASKTLQKKIESGASFDVAILSSNTIDDLIKAGKIVADTRMDLGRASIGVGVRAGTHKPYISTPEAMKTALLEAQSIAINRDGASSVHTREMIEHLGISNKVTPKLMLEVGSGQPQRDVVAGKAEMVITLIPEIASWKGLDLVGPLPTELQDYINFSAGVADNSHKGEIAKAVISFLASPAVSATLKSKGIEAR